MLLTIRNIDAKPTITPRRPEFNFDLTESAAEESSNTLGKHRYNMIRTIAGNKDSTMWYGSKFQPTNNFGNLLGHHDYWKHLGRNMKKGVKYPMSSSPR
eukprot:9636937-Ditylum_brightwellii.AAC.1